MLEWKNSRVISGVLRDPWQLLVGGRVFLTITEHRMQFREGGTGAGDIINRDFYLRDIKGIVPVYFCVSGEGGSSGVKKGYSLIVMFETGPFGTNDWRFIACTNPNADNDSIAEVRSWVDAVNAFIWKAQDKKVKEKRDKLLEFCEKGNPLLEKLLFALSGYAVQAPPPTKKECQRLVNNLLPRFVSLFDRFLT